MFDHLEGDCLDDRMAVARRLLRMKNPTEFVERACRLDNFNINLLFGYVRSFVRLAYLGDVNIAAKELGVTRQSIKRHIHELENLLECELFSHIGSPSRLSERGVLWMPRAQEFIELSGVFLNRRGVAKAEYQSTQLPLRMLMRDSSNSALLRAVANYWMQGNQATTGPEFTKFAEHTIIYERQSGTWAAKVIGVKSAFCQWFGPEIAKSSEGKTVAEMATGSDLRDEVSFLLDGVYTRGGLHFSEVSCKLQRPNVDGRVPVLFQRLLAEYVDELERPVVVSVIDIINLQKDL